MRRVVQRDGADPSKALHTLLNRVPTHLDRRRVVQRDGADPSQGNVLGDLSTDAATTNEENLKE